MSTRLYVGESELLRAVQNLAGLPLSSLPGKSSKGKLGEAVERALGIAPSSTAGPDVLSLGIEIKTLPVRRGVVASSTWVTSATPATLHNETWATSVVKRKLARVLFVPFDIDLGVLGTGFLWSPAPAEDAVLCADWCDLSDLVVRGLAFGVSARRGTWLQLRPKAKTNGDRRGVWVENGIARLPPLGFYLRRQLTERALQRAFHPTCRGP